MSGRATHVEATAIFHADVLAATYRYEGDSADGQRIQVSAPMTGVLHRVPLYFKVESVLPFPDGSVAWLAAEAAKDMGRYLAGTPIVGYPDDMDPQADLAGYLSGLGEHVERVVRSILPADAA